MGKEDYAKDDATNSWAKAEDTGKQVNVYIGDTKTGEHCHWWFDKSSGQSGIVHRGQCDDCRSGNK